MAATGAFRERMFSAWVEIRENLGRSTLQALGVMLGVASVLGGFSISDSQRGGSDELYARSRRLRQAERPDVGGDQGRNAAFGPSECEPRTCAATTPSKGETLDTKSVQGVSVSRRTRAPACGRRSPTRIARSRASPATTSP